jgi:hypothetical protein
MNVLIFHRISLSCFKKCSHRRCLRAHRLAAIGGAVSWRFRGSSVGYYSCQVPFARAGRNWRTPRSCKHNNLGRFRHPLSISKSPPIVSAWTTWPPQKSPDISVFGSLRFDMLFLHSKENHLIEPAYRQILADTAFSTMPTLVDLKRVIRLITLRLSSSEGRDHSLRALAFLLATILKRASSTLPSPDAVALKEFIFVNPGVIKSSLISDTLSDLALEGNFLYPLHFNRR